LIRENMNDIFNLIPSDQFMRVHKSFVVSVKHITMIEVHQLTINSEKIPIGSTYREGLKLRLGLDA
jgi:two-component system LytT family response regulator